MGKSQTIAKNKYNAKSYDRISVSVKKGVKEKWKSEAEKQGLSLNAFIEQAVNRMIKQEQEDKIRMVLALTLEELEVTVRTYNCLRKTNITTVSSFKQFIETNEINTIKGFYKSDASHLFYKLKEYEKEYNISLGIDYNNLLSQLPEKIIQYHR